MISQKNDIINILSLLTSKKDINDFLKDLMTQKELDELSNRFAVAKMLSEKQTYTQIEEKIGMSSTTIARVSKFLNGNNGGYQKALRELKSISEIHHTDHGTD